MKSSKISLTIFSLLSIGLISGCGNKNESEKSDKDTIVFAQNLDTKEKANSVMNSILEEYTKKTGTKVRFESLPSKDYSTWLTTQFSANKGPDVYTGIIYDMTRDYQANQLYDFKDLYDKESKYDPGKNWKDTLPEYIKERMYLSDGEVPGYPTSTSVVRIFCNKDIFKKAGVEEPKTWEEFMEVSKKIKDMGITPFAFPNATIDDLSWLWFNNSLSSQIDHEIVDEIDVDGNGYIELSEIAKATDEDKIDFTDEKLASSFELMKEFSNYWTTDFNGLDKKTATEMFARGEAAMIQVMSIDLDEIDSLVGDSFEYTVMPVPVVTKSTNKNAMEKSVILGGQPDNIFGINKALEKDKEKLDKAIDFVQYMSSPEVQLKLAESIQRIPLANSVDLPERLSGFKITEEPLRMPFYTGLNEKLRNYFHRYGQEYLSDGMDVKTLGQNMNKAYKEVIKEIKTENNWTAENNYGMKK